MLQRSGVSSTARLLEWGCGPGRILSHFAALMPQATLTGCDPNAESIAFAQRAFPNARFDRIDPDPPAPYAAASFDAIYGVSILTHLNEGSARAWIAELARLIAPTGCIVLTSHGSDAAARLAADQRRHFGQNRYVALGGARQGSRTFATYFSESAGRALFAAHFANIEFQTASESGFGQDLWVLSAPRDKREA